MDEIAKAVEAAIKAERERCAAVAESYKHTEARRIAAHIKEGSAPRK